MTQVQMKAIMVRAHQIARSCEGDYSARITLGLRQAWVEVRLLQIGNRWTKGAMDRIYINDLPRWYGLNVDHYKSGNICYAELNGERISNTQASKLLGRLSMAKVWYDVTTGKFHGKDIADGDFAQIVEVIKAA